MIEMQAVNKLIKWNSKPWQKSKKPAKDRVA